jgi:hypothetical protein
MSEEMMKGLVKDAKEMGLLDDFKPNNEHPDLDIIEDSTYKKLMDDKIRP